jgi:hypothetical protein
MVTPLFIIVLIIALVVILNMRRKYRLFQQEAFIRRYSFPMGLFTKLKEQHPTLTQRDCQLVSRALRQYFLAHLKSGRQFVSMPSQVVDTLWHEFILFTKDYQAFCDQAFGQFMHHSPAVSLNQNKASNEGLRRCWWYCCKDDNINPKQPARLPLLFAIDQKLAIAQGFSYVADCEGIRRLQDSRDPNANSGGVVHCGGDFSSTSFDGGTEGLGDSTSSSDSSGDSSGDGGSGCGGGCGGGGD